MYLPQVWQNILDPSFDIISFLNDFTMRVDKAYHVIPDQQSIFKLFYLIDPSQVKCVLYGEDPYPRRTSANGIAFWDQEIRSWHDKTRGNSLKHIMKALLIHKGAASYSTPIKDCRSIVNGSKTFPTPDELFISWINQGVMLLNRSLVFTNAKEKAQHFRFWEPFQEALIPYFKANDIPIILWGTKAQSMIKLYKKYDYPEHLIIKQGHPTYQHHFLDKKDPSYSPFTELSEKTGIQWV